MVFWSALTGWLLPTGILGGFHFWQFGRPYDWQLFSSLTAVGCATGIAARQFAQFGEYRMTYSLTLISGLTCFGINLARWLVIDGVDMRRGSLLNRTMSDAAFSRVRQYWLFGGLLCSAHQWRLGYRTPTFTTLLLHLFGGVLLSTAEGTIHFKGDAGARAAFDTLRSISIASLVLLGVLWTRDGLMLFLGKVNLQGERVDVLDDDDDNDHGDEPAGAIMGDVDERDAQRSGDDDKVVSEPIVPPGEWQCFRTHLGTKYYYDPATEMVHYLSASGLGNYAVDPLYNCTVHYDSLEELTERLYRRGQPGYGDGSQGAGQSLALDERGSAPKAAEQQV